jgi:hypothetical protein
MPAFFFWPEPHRARIPGSQGFDEMKHIVVTAADEAYEDLLFDLVASLQPHLESLNLAMGCLDIGLSDRARQKLASLPVTLAKPSWPFRPQPLFDADPKYLCRAARPFLPDLFPGFKTYVWMDADTWLQDPACIKWLVAASGYADLAGIPTVHRSYVFREHDMTWLIRRYEMAFGRTIAMKLMQQSYLNSGVFASSARSPLWKKFASRFQAALDRWQGDFLSDQAVLNAVSQLDGITTEKLPAQANWICHLARPVWDPRRRMFCAPGMPFEPLMILHNTFNAKQDRHPVRSLQGETISTSLTYRAFLELRDHRVPLTA